MIYGARAHHGGRYYYRESVDVRCGLVLHAVRVCKVSSPRYHGRELPSVACPTSICGI